jgi:hypothetical protein
MRSTRCSCPSTDLPVRVFRSSIRCRAASQSLPLPTRREDWLRSCGPSKHHSSKLLVRHGVVVHGTSSCSKLLLRTSPCMADAEARDFRPRASRRCRYQPAPPKAQGDRLGLVLLDGITRSLSARRNENRRGWWRCRSARRVVRRACTDGSSLVRTNATHLSAPCAEF